MIKCQLINAEGRTEIGHDHPATGTAVVDSSRRRRRAPKPWCGVSVRNRAVAHKFHQKTSVISEGKWRLHAYKAEQTRGPRLPCPLVEGGDITCLFVWHTGKGIQSLLSLGAEGTWKNPRWTLATVPLHLSRSKQGKYKKLFEVEGG